MGDSARGSLLIVEVAESDEKVVGLVRVAREALREQALELELH